MGKARKCSFVSSVEKDLYKTYKSKFSDDSVSLRGFNNLISGLQSDKNTNFNYQELLQNGQTDQLFTLLHEKSVKDKDKAFKESVILPSYQEFTLKDGVITPANIVTYEVKDGEYVFKVLRPTTESVEGILNDYLNDKDFKSTLMNNIKNNVQSPAELQVFFMYLAEEKIYNDLEDAGDKLSEEELATEAINKLNYYATINDALRAARRDRNKVAAKDYKGVVQTDDFKKNGFVSHNSFDGMEDLPELPRKKGENSKIAESYRRRTIANAENSDATIILCPWKWDSAGENLTRQVASGSTNKAGHTYNNGVNKKAIDITTKAQLKNFEELINTIIKNLNSMEHIDMEKGIVLNIAGNGMANIAKSGGSQEQANNIMFLILQGLLKKGVKINQVISGGQTGVDQAGIIAAAALGIPYRMHVAAYEQDGKVIYPLQVEPTAENPKGSRRFYARSANAMNEYYGRFSKSVINSYKPTKKGTQSASPKLTTKPVMQFNGYWTREQVANMQDKVFLFGDNTDDRVNTHHVPTSTQAVIRGLPNAIGIDTKKDRGTNESSYFSDADFPVFKKQVDEAIQKAKASGKQIVLPADGIGTGKAMLKEKAPKCFDYLQSELKKLYTPQQEVNEGPSQGGMLGFFERLTAFMTKEIANLKGEKAFSDEEIAEDTPNAANNSIAQLPDVSKEKEAADKLADENNRIKREIELKESPVARLHRAIGSHAPQIIQSRMQMFSSKFSEISDSIVEEYIDEQRRISLDDTVDAAKRDEANYNYVQASQADGGKQFVIAQRGNEIADMMKEQFKEELNGVETDFANGLIDEETYEYRKKQWQIVQDHFDTLFDLSKTIIERQEGIKISGSLSDKVTINNSSEADERVNENDGDNTEGKLATGNDGWVFKTRETDPHTRMSQAIKKLLRGIQKTHMDDEFGYLPDLDDLGQATYYNEDQLYAILVKEFSKVKEPTDFCVKHVNDDGSIEYDFPILEELTSKYAWLADVINLLDESLLVPESLWKDPNVPEYTTQIVSLFYSNFRNDFIPYWSNVDGKAVALNADSAQQSTLAIGVSNYEHGNVLSSHSVYNAVSGINLENVKYWGEKTNDGKKSQNRISRLSATINKFKDLDEDEARDAINEVVDLFKSIGIPYSFNEIQHFLMTDLGAKLVKNALAEANIIIAGDPNSSNEVIKKGLLGNPSDVNITDTFAKQYRTIGKHLDKVYEEYVQQSFREGDKTRYSYSTPNYIDTMTKFLNSDKETRQKYMSDTYGQYGWFVNKDEQGNIVSWKNEVLQRLWDMETIAFSDVKDMPIINFGEKHEYEDWTPSDISAAFFSEFWQNADVEKGSNNPSAYYNFSIFSDSPICKLVKMRRYTGDNGNYGTGFRAEMLTKLVGVAEQELWRMNLVRQRKKEKAKEIANFDKRGEKFCFFPSLNNVKASDLIQMLSNMSTTPDLTNEQTRGELKNLLIESGTPVDWEDIEDVKSKMEKAHNTLFESKLKELIETTKANAKTEDSRKDPTLLNLIEQCVADNNQSLKTDLLRLAIRDSVETSLYEFVNNNSEGLVKAIMALVENKKLPMKKSLTTDNVIPEDILSDYGYEIAQYFWNSTFATANIIQLTTTDLAFYKNGVDFQKRYKEVYASGTKLNTQSKYGKTIERTLYLKDYKMTVPTYDYLKKSLQEAVNNKDLHESEMEAILNSYQDITQTDAQAYRSVKSVRDVLDMLGQLTPALEDMFDRMLQDNYQYNYADFNSLIQTIKPFFFGHDTIDSGVKGAGLMNVPHQNKNSEFTLLSSVGMIAAIMNQSPQLKALNDFMIENDIDVVQFESAVKVGGQGIVDLGWSPSKLDEALNALNAGSYEGIDSSKYLQDKRRGNKEWSFTQKPEERTKRFKQFLDKQLADGIINSEKYNEIISNLTPNYDDTIGILKKECYKEEGEKGANEDALNALKQSTGQDIEDATHPVVNKLRPEIVHEHKYSDYMIATATPEHFFDATAIFGSQFRNIIISDINDEDEYEVNGTIYKGSQLKELYKKLIVENLLDKFEETKKVFGSIEVLQARLKKMIAGNPRYSDDLQDALEIVKDADGNLTFNIPLHNPTTTTKIQELLNSLWKKEVTKQDIDGGAAILVSDFGFSNSLRVIRNEDGSIKEVECYMPAYSKEFYKEYLRPDGTLDYVRMENECPDLLRVIGTRIPTEGKYSMLNLKIKGFLPQINGGALMLPAEITQTAGSDFDVDKVFLQFPKFRAVRNYDNKQLWNDFINDPKNAKYADKLEQVKTDYFYEEVYNYTDDVDYDAAMSGDIRAYNRLYNKIIKNSGKKQREFDESVAKFYEQWRARHKDEISRTTGKPYFTKTKYEKIKYVEERIAEDGTIIGGPANNSRAARNNQLIDIAYAILSNKAQSVRFSNPGSFNKIKRISRVSEIIENPRYRDQYMKNNGLTKDTIKEHLMNATLDELDDFLSKYGVERDILSPETFIYNHQQNMTGAKLIGMYANNNSMQSKFQNSGLSLKDEFTFDIKRGDTSTTIKQLDRQKTEPVGKDKVTEIISKNCAEWLAASVDNVKDPVLAKLLQNPKTANVLGFLIRAGVTIDEAGLFFRHPLIQYLVKTTGGLDIASVNSFIYELTDRDGKSPFKEVLDDEAYYQIDTDHILDLLMSDTYGELSINKLLSSNETATPAGIEHAQELLNMALLLKNKILPIADALSDMTRCCRADSPNGAIARTLPMALNQKIRLMNFWDKYNNGKRKDFPLENLGIMPKVNLFESEGIDSFADKESLRAALYNSGEGMMLQAFTTLGVVEPINIMSKWFKPFQTDILNLVSDIIRQKDNRFGTVSDDMIETIFSDLTTFILSKTEFFGDEIVNGKRITYEDKRNWYLYEFPKKFLEITSKKGSIYDDIKSLDIIKKLRVVKGEIVLQAGGALTPTTKTLLRQSMDSLLYMDNEEATQLALDLFAYAYYSKGFRFDSFDYAQFFSTQFLNTVGAPVIEALREYKIGSIKDTNGKENATSELANFKEQLLMNRYYDLLPNVQLKQLKKYKKDPKLLEDDKANHVEVPMNVVYNDHVEMDGELPSVFPRLRTDCGYYIYEGINPEAGIVKYKRIQRFQPEVLGDIKKAKSRKKSPRSWYKYNARMSAQEMASSYLENKKIIENRLEGLKKIFGSVRGKVYGVSAINSKVHIPMVNGLYDLAKDEQQAVKEISFADVNMANSDEVGAVSAADISMANASEIQEVTGMSASGAASAVDMVDEIDASEGSTPMDEFSGEAASASQYIDSANEQDASDVPLNADAKALEGTKNIPDVSDTTEKYNKKAGEAKDSCVGQ